LAFGFWLLANLGIQILSIAFGWKFKRFFNLAAGFLFWLLAAGC
jgi:hypothetical protein